MANPSALITGSTLTFYVTWSGVTPSQLSQFDDSDVQVKVASTGAILSGATAQVGSADGNTFPVVVTPPANTTGELYLFIRAQAIPGTSSYASRSPNVRYDTRPAAPRVNFSVGSVYTSQDGLTTTSTPYDLDSIWVAISSGTATLSDFTESDIVVTGACSSGLTPSSGSHSSWRLKLDITDGTKGTISLYILEDSVSVGNDAVRASFAYDRTSTSPTQTSATVTLGAAQSVAGGITNALTLTDNKVTAATMHIPIQFSKTVTGFSDSDVVVTNGCKGGLTPFAPANQNWTIEIGNLAQIDGFVTVGILANVVNIQSGGNIAVTNNYAVKRGGPAVTASPVIFQIGNAYRARNPVGLTHLTEPLDEDVVYIDIAAQNKAAPDFAIGDIFVSGGYPSSFYEIPSPDAPPNRRWTIACTIPDEEVGTLSISIPPNVVADGNASVTQSFQYNRVTPVSGARSVTIGLPWTAADGGTELQGEINRTNNPGGDFYVPIDFGTGEAVTGFTPSDVLVTTCKGGLTESTTSPGRIWRLQIDPDDNFEGWVTVSVQNNVISNSGGNMADNRSFKVDYSRATTTGNPTTFTILNAYSAATGGTSLYNPGASSPAAITAATFYVHIRSTLAVSDFTSADINVSGGCKGDLTELTGTGIDDNTQWRLEISAVRDTAGVVTITIPPNVVDIGNENISEEYEYDYIVVEPPPVTCSIGAAYTSSTGTGTISGEITDGEFWVLISFGDPGPGRSITGFRDSDVVVNNACKGGLTPHGTTGRAWRLHIDNLNDFQGVVTITVPTDIIRQGSTSSGNYAATKNFNVNTIESPSVPIVATASWSNISGGTGLMAVLTGRITFSGATVVDIYPGDFSVLSGSSEQSGWTIQTSHSTTTDTRSYVDITATPNKTVNGNFGLRLRSLSVSSGGSVSVNAPATNVDSTTSASVNNSPVTADPIATITSGGFDGDDTVYFYAYWENATPIELLRFTSADITITGAGQPRSSRNPNGYRVSLGTPMGSAYPFSVTSLPDNTNGTLKATIRANALGVDTNLAIESSCIPYDTTGDPTPTSFTIGDVFTGSSGGSRINNDNNEITTSNETVWVHITSTVAVTDFTSSDVIVSGGCAGQLYKQTGVDNNTQWRIYIDTSDNESGYFTVAISANVVGIGNESKSRTFSLGKSEKPYLEVTNLPTAVQTGRTITLTIQSKVDGDLTNTSGLTNNDIRITSDDNITGTLS